MSGQNPSLTDTAELDKLLAELLAHEPKCSTPTTVHRKVNRLTIDHPAAETYNRFTLDQIRSLCESVPGSARDHIVPPLDPMSEEQLRHYRLWAYWAKRGADDPSWAAHLQAYWETLTEEVIKDYRLIGFLIDPAKVPRCLADLGREFLPKPAPNIHRIIQRCPQMAMIHALRGDVSEPYWWAALAITENATPNLSRECSDGYSKFSEAELAERVTRIRNEKKRPALCDRIDSVNRNVCTVCRFRGSVNSPIALGFEHEPKRKAVAP